MEFKKCTVCNKPFTVIVGDVITPIDLDRPEMCEECWQKKNPKIIARKWTLPELQAMDEKREKE
jgi:hypothetical protein